MGDALLVDLAAEPIKDQRQSSTAPDLGYAGCLTEGYGDCAWFYDPAHADETWKLFEEAGARVLKQWDSVMIWQRGLHESKAGNPDPKWCFDFWKKHGVKVLLTLEHRKVFEDAACTKTTDDLETVKRTILDYVRWIVKNGYQDVVGGFELGNESYYDKNYASLAPMGEPRLEVGACGVMYRILAEAIKEHPLILRHGTSKEADTEDAFFTSARVMDQVYARRRALKEGRTGRKVPKVEGEVEWVALADARREELCLLMVNTKSEPATVTLTARGKDHGADVDKEFASPTYRTLSCPEKFLDCRAVPGDGHPWTQLSWEDTQTGYAVISMAPNEGLKPAASSLTVEIAPHTVQSVTVRLRNAPKQ